MPTLHFSKLEALTCSCVNVLFFQYQLWHSKTLLKAASHILALAQHSSGKSRVQTIMLVTDKARDQQRYGAGLLHICNLYSHNRTIARRHELALVGDTCLQHMCRVVRSRCGCP